MATNGKIAITIAAIVLSALLSRSRKNKKGKLPLGPHRLPLIWQRAPYPEDVTFSKEWLTSQATTKRKIVIQDLAPRMTPRYYVLQEAEARLLAKDVLENPSQLEQIVKRIGTIIIRITYGHYITADDDPFLTGGRPAMNIFSASAEPGVRLMDSVLLLKYLPAWFPGTRFLATAKAWREIVHKAAWEPYLWSKRAWESGSVLMPNACAAVEGVDGRPSPAMEEQFVLGAFTLLEGERIRAWPAPYPSSLPCSATPPSKRRRRPRSTK
ncbi:putative monooxygenase [Mycena sanguinolenta]|uniref:Putative monooxygenase n=1 Tax=Mycena sanguinolenta TaxID=230812 RepID=A0A8H7D1S1_9AGAR|nr:putative monooxygenase [Mycena sanguinolenta]